MRLAVLSDIHANLAALEAVRDDMPQVDEVWVLGDIVGYGPQPNEVIAALQEMGAPPSARWMSRGSTRMPPAPSAGPAR